MNNPPGHSREYLQSEQHKIMGEEYSKLSQKYIKFYLSRMTVFSVFFFGAIVYCNDYFEFKGEKYADFTERKEFQTYGNIVRMSQNMIESMAQMTKVAIQQTNQNNQSMYCRVNQTNEQCKSFLSSYQENQVIMKSNGIYPSYQCLLGDCVLVSNLIDYYWHFMVTLPYLNSIIVQYSFMDNAFHRFIVPPLVKVNRYDVLTDLDYSQKIHYLDGTLILVKQLQQTSLSIKIGFIMDQTSLLSNYQISTNNFNYNPKQSSSKSTFTFTYKNNFYFDKSLSSKYFQITKWAYTFIFMCIGFLIGLPVVFILKQLINNWFFKIFKELAVLNNLYKYQINSIFEGKQPKTSVVLNQTCFTQFYEDLSEIVGKDAEPCITIIQSGEKQEPFKFLPLVQNIMNKFQQSCKPIQQQRSKEFSNLKLPIRTAVSEISENVNIKLKDIFMKSRQLNLSPQFFHFGYLCLLQPTSSYQSLLLQQSIPLPSAMIELFRYMNHTINSQDLKFTFKFAFTYESTIQQQIIIKLQDNLLQKYLNALSSLDVGDPNYAVKLKLKKRLVKLEKELENRRHIFVAYLK